MAKSDDNPFDLQKASHYSIEEILGFWVDIAQGGLVSVLEPTSITPMLLLGGKGSGKTHLMRYCSAPVQAARHGSLIEAIRSERYVGIYVPAEALNTHKFAGKGLEEDAWAAAFGVYFENWLASNLLEVARDALGDAFFDHKGDKFSRDLRNLFDIDVDLSSLSDTLNYLVGIRKKSDHIVNMSALTRNISDLDIPFSTGNLLFGLPDLIGEYFPELGKPLFVYLIDELENFTSDQQKLLNTLIRYRKGRATIKIGARLYGVRTFATLGSGEPIRPGSEFTQVVLDRFLRDHADEYRRFAVDLTLSRLKRSGVTSIQNEEQLLASFEDFGRDSHWRAQSQEIVHRRDRDGRPRPYMVNLERKLQEAGLPKEAVVRVLSALEFREQPFLEKVSTFVFIRKWNGKDREAQDLAERISQDAAKFVEKGRAASPEYGQAISHFSSDLLAQMYREARRRLPYAGFDTLIELSQGIPRNLLGMLSHIYRRALFAGENPFGGGKITIQSQTYGVIEGAKAFWNDAQPDADVTEVRESVEGLALLFRSIRFSDAPSECDLCTFSVNLEKLTERSKQVIRTAENWSNLIRIEAGSKNKNTASLDAKFQFSPMLAPLWEISHHRRGNIELNPDIANAIFDPSRRDDLPHLVQSRVANMYAPRMWNRVSGQEKLI